MVRPAGSFTTGFSVTKSSARNIGSRCRPLAGEALKRLEVASTRSHNHLVGERRSGGLFVPAQMVQVITQVLLVERRFRSPRAERLPVPETHGIRRPYPVD